MIYKHQYFRLDTDKRQVFDENDRELRITGNAYRVMAFLCEKGVGTVTDIGEYLDYAKDYDENHLRQYRYKINTIVGHDVIAYNNGVYTISGLTQKTEEFQRNTVSLQVQGLQSAHDSINPTTMSPKTSTNPSRPWYKKRTTWVITAAVLLAGIASPFVWQWYTTRISPHTPQTTRINCPTDKPIKGNAQSGIYHVPGGQYYHATRPERCFATEANAVTAGYRKSTK